MLKNMSTSGQRKPTNKSCFPLPRKKYTLESKLSAFYKISAMYFHVNILHTASGTEGLTIKAKQKISITITSCQIQYTVFSHMLIYDINII